MRYRFGQFELDAERYELSRAGEKLVVRPKVFDMLRYLVERPETLVTKQELLDALWNGQVVNETSVPWTIGHVRRIIGQQSGDNAPIETVHGRGYRWRGAIEVSASRPASTLPPRSAAPFVGREALMTALDERLVEVRAGRGGVCLLVGDAGIGKTRCIDELSALARTQGFAVWAGRSAQDTLAPVYFPWIQLLRAAGGQGPQQRELAGLLSRLEAAEDVTSQAHGGDRDAVLGRLSLFEAVSRFLIEAGRHTPLLLVLDDLHWADAGTVELLGYVSAELRNAHVLVVAAERIALTASDTPARHSSALLRHAERCDLPPLSVESVMQYLSAFSAGSPPSIALCEAVHRVSAGYPLFVQETVRSLVAQHGRENLSALPAGSLQPSEHARDVLSSRLAALDPRARQLLGCASVLGESFETASLAQLSSEPLDTLLHALDQALQSGFVLRVGERFCFRHALFREVVYAKVPTADRVRWHRAVALMRQSAPDAAQHKSEIAQHFHRSLALGDYAQVRAAALDAAQAAARAQSFADAAQFYAWALEAIALDPAASTREYAQLLLERAHAQRCAGSSDDARVTIEQLVRVASQHGYPDLLIESVRALRLSHAMASVPDPLARGALERVLELEPEESDPARLQAMSLLAWLPPDALDMPHSKQLSAHALELARGLGQPMVLVEALTARFHALSGPDDIDALLSTSSEMLALDREPRGWISVEAYSARHLACLHRGDLAGADAVLDALGAIAQTRGFLELDWHVQRHRALRRFQAGDLAQAEAAFAKLEEESARLRVGNAAFMTGLHRMLVTIARHGPRAFSPGERPEFFREQLSPARSHAPARANLARLALAFDQTEPARQVLGELSTGNFKAVPKDVGYLHTLCNLALVAIGVSDRERAERLYALLEPYPRHNTPNVVGLYDGPVTHFLALLGAFLDRRDAAERHFAAALEHNEKLGLRPFLARSHFEYARWLLRTGRRGQGLNHRQRALELAEQIGMDGLAAKARALVTQ